MGSAFDVVVFFTGYSVIMKLRFVTGLLLSVRFCIIPCMVKKLLLAFGDD